MPEISESEFLRLSKLNDLANKIAADPEAGILLERAAKIVEPTIKTPRIERAEHANAPLKEMTATLAALQKRLDDDENARKQNEIIGAAAKIRNDGIAELRARHYTDEGIASIEKVMTEKGIMDPLDAAAIFERNNPPPAISKPYGSSWNFAAPQAGDTATDKALQALLASRGNDEGAVDTLVSMALADSRSSQVHR